MTVTTDADHVTVRMYNVGFGDAFLVVFPDRERQRRVLIDCGSHSAGPGPRPMAEMVEQIVTDVTDHDGVPRIDVVIGTHRHQDHVSGFTNGRWADVEVEEVWMPWTEDPRDPEARSIRERQSSAARHLCLALGRLGAEAGALDLARNSLTNERAMRTLHAGFAGRPRRRFLPARDQPRTLESAALGRVRVHLLGPSRDPEVIRDMEPPAGEAYLRLLGAAEYDEAAARPPFPGGWDVSPDEIEATPELSHLTLKPRDLDLLSKLAAADTFALAVALEKAVNGTSLVLMFELGEGYLLFPGDAQWGTWHGLLHDVETRPLLERTTFLKVGHHGSHNGTPKDFVEALQARQRDDDRRSDLLAMVSTRQMERWKEIPKAELCEALAEATPALARSDAGTGPAVPGFAHWDDAIIEAKVPIA
jgi:beta-lactamase superfamily II metal-dependent hydrolase